MVALVRAVVADEPAPGLLAEGGDQFGETLRDDLVMPFGMGVDPWGQPPGVRRAGPLPVAAVGQHRQRPDTGAGCGGTGAYQRDRDLVGVSVDHPSSAGAAASVRVAWP